MPILIWTLWWLSENRVHELRPEGEKWNEILSAYNGSLHLLWFIYFERANERRIWTGGGDSSGLAHRLQMRRCKIYCWIGATPWYNRVTNYWRIPKEYRPLTLEKHSFSHKLKKEDCLAWIVQPQPHKKFHIWLISFAKEELWRNKQNNYSEADVMLRVTYPQLLGQKSRLFRFCFYDYVENLTLLYTHFWAPIQLAHSIFHAATELVCSWCTRASMEILVILDFAIPKFRILFYF